MGLQIRRGLDANRTFIAAEGEPLWVTDTDRLFVGDGATTGGKAVKALPVGTAGGDLSGSFPNPTVAKVQGVAVESGTPSDGETLVYESANTRWAHKKVGINGYAVETGAPSNNESLVWNSTASQWEHKHPVLTSSEAWITVDVPGGAGWTTIATISLAAGTWLVNGQITGLGNGVDLQVPIRLYHGSTVISSGVVTGAPSFEVTTSITGLVTFGSTTSMLLQAKLVTEDETVLCNAGGSLAKASGMVCVRIA